MSDAARDAADDPAVAPAEAAATAPTPPASDAELNRRVQILATEHWGLLAARSTAQSEVLTRITIFLTLVSAGLLTIGLLGQASKFSDWFVPCVLAILAFLCLIGFMTVVRVMNVAEEDLMYVVAMNRLRGAYVELDPHIEQFLLESTADDMAGMKQTYSFLRVRGASVLLGSSSMLLFVVNGCVFGLFAGAIVASAGGAVGWAIAAGVLVGVALVVSLFWFSGAMYLRGWKRYIPRRATAGPPPFLRN